MIIIKVKVQGQEISTIPLKKTGLRVNLEEIEEIVTRDNSEITGGIEKKMALEESREVLKNHRKRNLLNQVMRKGGL